jgi:LL-diaminopimelate aminotransferase
MTRIGWRMEKPQATMFVWAQIPEKFRDSETFSKELLEKSGVLVTPGSAFGPSGEGYVRLALVQDEEVLIQAADLVDKSGILRFDL